jgi:NitT/TauT family transport system ATP-binding protein
MPVESVILIEARELTFEYEDKLILQDISFSLHRGEKIAFVGLSGCGKTTLLKLLAGILKPSRGSLTLAVQKVGYVSQSDGLLPWLSVIENVLLHEKLHAKEISQLDRQEAMQMLKRVGLEHYEQDYPHQLSGGMRKRVELARAFLRRPDLLLLDEPFTSLDLFNREKLNLLTQELCREHHIALTLVTHSLDEAYFLADTVMGLAGRPAGIAIRHSSMGALKAMPKETDDGRQAMHDFFYNAVDSVRVLPVVKLRISAKRFLRSRLLPLVLSMGVLALTMSLIKRVFSLPDYLMPDVTRVIEVWWQTLVSGMIGVHVWATLNSALRGFFLALIVAVPLGYCFSQSRVLRAYGMPLVLMSNTIPTVAVAPFIVLWFGYGLTARLIIVFLIVWLPMLIGSYQAFTLSHVHIKEQIEFFRPKALRRLWTLQLPASLAALLGSIKVSITLCIVGAVVGEFVAGSTGLGALINIAKASYQMPLMFAALLWLMILGLLLYGAATLVEKLLLRRHAGYLHILAK